MNQKISFQSKYIIARYEESLDWLNCFPKQQIIIYNKGNTPISKEYITYTLPNVGRESHTYLHYILENYDNLPDVCIFMQGKIKDHIHWNIKDEEMYVKKMEIETYIYGISQNYIRVPNIDEERFKWARYDFNLHFETILRDQFQVKEPVKEVFWKWFEKNIGIMYPNKEIRIYGGAIFGVRKDILLTRSKEYYKNLYDQLSKDNSPIEGHFMERSWKYICIPKEETRNIHEKYKEIIHKKEKIEIKRLPYSIEKDQCEYEFI
jgi:hypothetical protein